jgi:hypothetical protein
MRTPAITFTTVCLCLALHLGLTSGCTFQPSEQRKPRTTLFIGVDASGSFKQSGYYDNAMTFLAHYIYGHLHELGGLDQPKALFVGTVGGRSLGEPKTFHPIHDFEGKDVTQIEADLRKWFQPTDTLTDFNPFFEEVARITKERNLVLAPITILVVTDGVPDYQKDGAPAGSKAVYQEIKLNPLEYLARNITLRLTYVSPKVGDHWRSYVPRNRVRLWTVDGEVMKGWKNQLVSDVPTEQQERFWKWVQENVDFPIRSSKI